MARIRTVKPSFYRHEALQDLERAHHSAYPMLVFQGLWGHCDKHGVFPWKPRQLKLDILPFLDFEMADTLDVLEDSGFLVRFVADGQPYGYIPTFPDHQRINGRESKDESSFPAPPDLGKQSGSTAEALRKQQGQQEGKGIGTEVQEGNGVVADDGFDRFWSAYPNKVGKDAARKEWLRRAPDAALQRTILDAIEVHKASPQWTRDAGQFIPHPRTWLHHGRWQDDVKPITLVPTPPPVTPLTAITKRLEVHINRHAFIQWVVPLRFVRASGQTVVAAAGDLVVEWLRKHYADAITQACADLGPDVRLELITEQEETRESA